MSQVSKSAGKPGSRRCSDAQTGSPLPSLVDGAEPSVRLAYSAPQLGDAEVRRAIAAMNEAARLAYVLTQALHRVVYAVGSGDAEAACSDAAAAGALAGQAGYLADFAASLLGGVQECGGAEYWLLPHNARPGSLPQGDAA